MLQGLFSGHIQAVQLEPASGKLVAMSQPRVRSVLHCQEMDWFRSERDEVDTAYGEIERANKACQKSMCIRSRIQNTRALMHICCWR